ncbi:MAG: hypothetical protein JXN59_05100 [Anaerolineae bacterium]|nr:hypothetical protein [Anaerolineae bacterium]
MKRTRYAIIPLLLLVILLAGCDGSSPLPVAVSPIPVTPPTVTPGGLVVMALPTPAPVTPTPQVVEAVVPTFDYALLAASSPVSCPAPGSPEPPPAPATFNLYATAINRYLSEGATVPALAEALAAWGVVDETQGLVTDAYDLTGDGVFEVLVIIHDPFNADIAPAPGQLLIYGCGQGDYRLLYASDYGPGFGVPALLYAGDINANSGPEVVFFQERCQSGACVKAAQVLSWSQPSEGFIALNVDTVGSADGRFSLADLDGDNVQEIMIQGGGVSTDISAGPPRSLTTIWDWNGMNYVRASTRLDAPLYRIHMVHDADIALASGRTADALRYYQEALDNPRLGSWQVPNEPVMLRAYVLFKLIVAYAYLDEDGAAGDARAALLQENPSGAPGYAYAQVGDSFWQVFQSTRDMHAACLAAAEAVARNPQAVLFLNGYGPANRNYQIPDICPF